MKWPSGQCSSGQCGDCPGSYPERTWPDPHHKGQTYTVEAKTCPHICHTRDLPV